MTAKGYDLVDVAYLLVYVEYDALHPISYTEIGRNPGDLAKEHHSHPTVPVDWEVSPLWVCS